MPLALCFCSFMPMHRTHAATPMNALPVHRAARVYGLGRVTRDPERALLWARSCGTAVMQGAWHCVQGRHTSPALHTRPDKLPHIHTGQVAVAHQNRNPYMHALVQHMRGGCTWRPCACHHASSCLSRGLHGTPLVKKQTISVYPCKYCAAAQQQQQDGVMIRNACMAPARRRSLASPLRHARGPSGMCGPSRAQQQPRRIAQGQASMQKQVCPLPYCSTQDIDCSTQDVGNDQQPPLCVQCHAIAQGRCGVSLSTRVSLEHPATFQEATGHCPPEGAVAIHGWSSEAC